MKTDTQLQKDVMDELKWEPTIKPAEIGVSAKDGIVTLNGYVDSYEKKRAAKRVAVRIFGIREVVNEIKVRLPDTLKRPDEDIAQAAVNVLQWNIWLTQLVDRIQVGVDNGWITLSGDVDWWYQKDAAGDTVRKLLGVRGLTNNIAISPRSPITVDAQEVKDKIESALRRNALLDSRRIIVETRSDKVILRGSARNWAEREQVELAAYAAPSLGQ
jgi:osmotically-inducible protein OsmY